MKNLVNWLFDKLELFLKYTHETSDYQYHVSENCIDQAIELLNIFSTCHYVCKILYIIVNLKRKQLIMFEYNSSVVWLTYMFCLNWEAETAWMWSETTQTECNHIVNNFNNSIEFLQIFISMHQVDDLEINLQLFSCHHMIVLELSHNLNTLV